MIQGAVGDIPLEFHAHCNNGLAPINALEAVKEGIHYIHTAVPPLANGTSQPSIFNVAANLRAMGYTPVVDEAPLRALSERLTAIARQHGLPSGSRGSSTTAQYAHQVPGGMMSNLRYQLRLIGHGGPFRGDARGGGAGARRVRLPDHGHAALAVRGHAGDVQRDRGRAVQRGTRRGDPARAGVLGPGGDHRHGPAIRAKILDRPRAREWERWEQPQPSLAEIRREYGQHVSDEEIVLRYYAGGEGLKVRVSTARPRSTSARAIPWSTWSTSSSRSAS